MYSTPLPHPPQYYEISKHIYTEFGTLIHHNISQLNSTNPGILRRIRNTSPKLNQSLINFDPNLLFINGLSQRGGNLNI